MPKAAIFDVDGTLIDSVDLHALAWQQAFAKFGRQVDYAQVRGQIGKGGDKLMPVFLTEREQKDFSEELEKWRAQLFKTDFLPLVRPFAAVPELFRRARSVGLKIGIASSAKKSELDRYLDIARVKDLIDEATSSEDVEQSKPAPDIFQVALKKLNLDGRDAIAIGDSPYDAQSARKCGVATIGLLSGGFAEADLRDAGCKSIYPGPAALLACFKGSPLDP